MTIQQKKQLFITYPRIAVDQTTAVLWAILDREKSLPWLLNYFTQITGYKYYQTGYILFDESNINWRDCPFFDYQTIDRDMFKSITTYKRHLCDAFLQLLDNGYYIYTMLDQFYNPHDRTNYDKIHFAHHTFIYGYDINQKTFNIADFYNKGRYNINNTLDFTTINRSSNIEKCLNLQWLDYRATRVKFELGSSLVFFKYVDQNYAFDTELFKQLLQDYLDSGCGVNRFEEKKEKEQRGNIYGLNNYQYMIKAMEYIGKKKKFTWNTIKALCVIDEHKKILLSCIQYLKEKKLLTNADNLYREYSKIRSCTRQIRNLFMNFTFNKNDELLKKTIVLLDKVYRQEPVILKQFIANIKTSKYSNFKQYELLEKERFKKEINDELLINPNFKYKNMDGE